MNGKKSMPIIMAAAGIISLIGAILLFVLAVPRADATYKRVMEIMIATLMLILSALVFYYLYISRDVEPNFFLFDRTKKKNLPVEKLNPTASSSARKSPSVCTSPEVIMTSTGSIKSCEETSRDFILALSCSNRIRSCAAC